MPARDGRRRELRGWGRRSFPAKIKCCVDRLSWLSNSGQWPALALNGSVANDPNVWSGRASQEVFVELAVSGLASMYPASDWSVLCSWPSWISARVRSH
jgi:hypothetical protein